MDVRIGLERKLSTEELMLLNYGVGNILWCTAQKGGFGNHVPMENEKQKRLTAPELNNAKLKIVYLLFILGSVTWVD